MILFNWIDYKVLCLYYINLQVCSYIEQYLVYGLMALLFTPWQICVIRNPFRLLWEAGNYRTFSITSLH